jgi:hypothetical protein
MIRELGLSVAAMALFGSASANEAQPQPATYILQVASNLNCAQLDVQVLDAQGQSAGALVFHTGAFTAASLPPGPYSLGTVTCHDGSNGTESFDHLKDAIAAFSVDSGQAYFGGKLIIQATTTAPDESEPDVVTKCIRGTGRFRKEPSDDCRDGAGIDTQRRPDRAINFYAPRLEASNVDAVRTALSATENELLYMPLEVVSH